MEPITRYVQFNSGHLVLEGMFSAPAAPRPIRGVLLCHPHPQYGGDMDNSVVRAVGASLQAAGFAILRFNYRGVQGSDGEYDEGHGEVEDVLEAISFLEYQPGVDPGGIFLVGYSFGAFVGLQASLQTDQVLAAAAISPPLGRCDFSFLGDGTIPLVVICGDRDQFCSTGDIDAMCAKLKTPVEKHILRGVDHFYWGKETLASAAVSDYFLSLKL